MEYLATFHTHFDALKYHKYIKGIATKAIMKPVPRQLSSSCGSCVVFVLSEQLSMEELRTEDMERFYLIEGSEYRLLLENE